MFRLLKKFRNRIQILLYHRVANVTSDPQMLCVTPDKFYDQMKFLKKNYNIISLSSINQLLKNHTIPRNSVVITFDDGYQDNLINAIPILEEHNLPATFFITSGYIGENKEFYQEALNRIFFLEKQIPKTLNIKVNQIEHQYLELDQENQKKAAYTALHKALRSEKNDTRKSVIKELIDWSGACQKPLIDYKNLTFSEIKQISQKSLFEIGAHSVNHPVLSGLNENKQRVEIVNSKIHLEKIIEKDVTSFAYPYGTIDSYNVDTINILRENNFLLCCSNYSGLIDKNTSRYELPRFLVRDLTIEKFKPFLKNNFLNY